MMYLVQMMKGGKKRVATTTPGLCVPGPVFDLVFQKTASEFCVLISKAVHCLYKCVSQNVQLYDISDALSYIYTRKP